MQFKTDAFRLFGEEWALLTAGDSKSYNTMTIAWGGLGTLWGKPIATVYVKPIRYTHRFMEENDYFTVSFYPEAYKKALGLLGSKSGRDCNKVALSGLTPKFLPHGVTFEEARATLVLKKIYRQELDLSAIPEDAVKKYYLSEPVHTMYVGELQEIL